MTKLTLGTVALTTLAIVTAPQAHAEVGPQAALSAIESSGGHYVWSAASLAAADCSGLVSVAQDIATGQPIHRLGDTHTLMAGRWPGVLPGAGPDDEFIIASSPSHMMAQIDGVRIESRTKGQPFLVGDQAADPWGPQFTVHVHVDPALLVN